MFNRTVFGGATSFGSAAIVLALSAGVGFAATDYVGKYKTEDSKGQPMEITLLEDGTATGKRAEEDLSGKWKENKKAMAVIHWEDGWITKLSAKEDSYRKIGFEKGKRKEAHKGAAEKIE